MDNISQLQKKAIDIRKSLLQMIVAGNTGHTGGSLSSVDLLVSLFYHTMNFHPGNQSAPDRDRFILSKGHSVEAYYAILADRGFFPQEELANFSHYESRLIGHPSIKVPGVEMNTGALGHGLSVGGGMALAAKMDQLDSRVFVLMGDGEQAEGSIWEAAMAASHHKLDNLVGIVDRNYLQISGNTEDVMSLDDLSAKWTAFGWQVHPVDGNNIQALVALLDALPRNSGKPQLILANTIKGRGVSFMENNAKWHHGVPSREELAQALAELTAAEAEGGQA